MSDEEETCKVKERNDSPFLVGFYQGFAKIVSNVLAPFIIIYQCQVYDNEVIVKSLPL